MTYYIAMDSYNGEYYPGTLALKWEKGYVHYAEFDYSPMFASASGGETHAETLCHQLRSAVETQNGVPAAAVAVTPAQVEEAHAHGVTAARQWARDNAPNPSIANDFTQGNFAQNDFGQTDMGPNDFGANPPMANDFGASAPGGNAAPGTPPVPPQP